MTSLVPIFLVARWAEASWRVRAPGTEVWATILIAGVLSVSIVAADLEVPTFAVGLPQDIEPVEPGQSTMILDRHGRVLARLDEGFDRRVVPAEELPRLLHLAVVAIEDDSFFEHDGIRPLAIARAFVTNLSQGEVEQGGSTITQQFVRGAYEEVGRERSIGRKLREAAAAVRVEQTMSKDEILTAYLNRVYLGRGAYGADAAARAYFGRPARRLDLARSAFLAGLIHAPVAYQDRPKAARLRRNLVLDRMADLGFISDRRARRAKARPLELRSPAPSVRAPYFVEYVRQQLLAPRSAGGFEMTDEQVTRGGYRIHTTLDLQMQRAAERAVRDVADRRGDPEVALASISTDGAVRAMIGGRSQRPPRARGFNFAVQRSPSGGRLPGSTFKPFALAAYLEQGGGSARSLLRARHHDRIRVSGSRRWSLAPVELRRPFLRLDRCDHRNRVVGEHRVRPDRGRRRTGADRGHGRAGRRRESPVAGVLARARDFGGDAAGDGARLRDPRGAGCPSRRPRDPLDRGFRRRGDRAARAVPGESHGSRARRHRERGPGTRRRAGHGNARRHRSAGGRQDRHQRRRARSLVRRVHAPPGAIHRGVGGAPG